MNDVREVIDRITLPFEPASGFHDLSRRRGRARTRRRVVAGATALTMAAGGSLFALRAFSGQPAPSPGQMVVAATWPASAAVSPTAQAAAQTPCPAPSADDRAWALSSTSGPAGSSVDVTGISQDGEFWLQLWWNADGDDVADKVGPPPWPPAGPDLRIGPAGPGPVMELISVVGPASGGACSYHARFTVPDVDPGTYQLVFVAGWTKEPPGGGYAVLTSSAGSLRFEVSG